MELRAETTAPREIARTFEADKAWADTYMGQVRAIIEANAGKVTTVRIATASEDLEEATDCVLEVEGSGKIAVRVREARFLRKFRDVTIRSHRPSGAPTELAKLKAKLVRWYLYCWVEGGRIAVWVLWDVHRAVDHGLFEKRAERRNSDGTRFIGVPIEDLRNTRCIRATSAS